MSIFENIDKLSNTSIDTEASAQEFLNTLDLREQEQLIDTIYLGRDHIHHNEIREENLPINEKNRQSHISSKNFARILYEKKESLDNYFRKAVECAKNSDLDLNDI